MRPSISLHRTVPLPDYLVACACIDWDHPAEERLAFPALAPREEELPEILPAPLPEVVRVLRSCSSVEEVYRNLSDLAPGLHRGGCCDVAG